MNGKTLLFISFLFVTNSIYSQSKTKYGLCIQPHYSRYIGMYTKDKAVGDYTIRAGGTKVSFSMNAFIEKQITKRKRRSIGIGYQNGGLKTGKTAFSKSYIKNDSSRTHFKLTSHLHNIEIPININYSLGKRAYLSYGVSGIFNVSNVNRWVFYNIDGSKSVTYQKMKDNDKYIKFNVFNIALNFGVGYDIVQSDKYDISLKPTFQIGLINQEYGYNAMSQKPIFLGLDMVFKFNQPQKKTPPYP